MIGHVRFVEQQKVIFRKSNARVFENQGKIFLLKYLSLYS